MSATGGFTDDEDDVEEEEDGMTAEGVFADLDAAAAAAADVSSSIWGIGENWVTASHL